MVNPNQHDAVSQLSTIRTSADDAAFVALGVIIRPGAEPRPFDYHGATAGTRGAVGWRYVVTADDVAANKSHGSDAKYLSGPCMDGERFMQLACWCKSVWFFRKAPGVFRRAARRPPV